MNSNKKNMTRIKKRGKKTGSSQIGVRVDTHPPRMVAQNVRGFHLRTLATGVLASQVFTIGDLAGILGVIALTATSSRFLSQVFRLVRVRVWGPVATAGTPVSVVLQWNNTANDFAGPPIELLDTSVSFDWPAFVDGIPPPGSLSSKWHSSQQADTTFTLSCPAGSTVDFWFEWVLSDLQLLNGPVIAGATVAEIYHLTTHALVPQGVNTV
jgi:hypothetical protein